MPINYRPTFFTETTIISYGCLLYTVSKNEQQYFVHNFNKLRYCCNGKQHHRCIVKLLLRGLSEIKLISVVECRLIIKDEPGELSK